MSGLPRRRDRLAAAVVGVGLAAAALAGCSSGQPHPVATRQAHADAYGKLPAFLPKNTVRNDAPIAGTNQHPAVTSEGDQVQARLTDATVRAEVSGPVVPGEGFPNPADDTTCTWQVTLDGATAPVAVRVADFNAIDHLGAVYRVAPVPGQPAIPHEVAPGQRVTFELRTAMPTGEGLMRWAPDGRHIVGEWDFTVEND